MTPGLLRAKCQVSAAEMARRLSMSVGSLRVLEATPTTAWKVQALASYVGCLGLQLELAAIDSAASREVLT